MYEQIFQAWPAYYASANGHVHIIHIPLAISWTGDLFCSIIKCAIACPLQYSITASQSCILLLFRFLRLDRLIKRVRRLSPWWIVLSFPSCTLHLECACRAILIHANHEARPAETKHSLKLHCNSCWTTPGQLRWRDVATQSRRFKCLICMFGIHKQIPICLCDNE